MRWNRTIAITCLLFLLATNTFAGECLQSTEEMYEELLHIYKEAKNGNPSGYFGWLSQGCGGSSNIMRLLKKMSLDHGLDSVTRAEAIKIYAAYPEAIDDLLKIIENSEGGIRETAIMSILPMQYGFRDYASNFNLTDFLKTHIPHEKNDNLRKQMILSLTYPSYKNRMSFDDFLAFCKKHNLAIEDEMILNFDDLKPIAYIFETKHLIGAQPLYADKEKMKEYFKYSKQLLSRLGRQMEMEFPIHYLERISSRDLRLLKNGIFAFYGKNFKSKVLQYYFYGETPYVESFCKNNICGNRENRKKLFDASKLTSIDLRNIDAISNIELKRQTVGYKEDFLIENYDLAAFIQGKADNFVLTSSELREIYQVKVDWDNKVVWLWDKGSVSGWDLQSEKRVKLYSGAKGPIGLTANKHLLSYQLNGTLIVENIKTHELIFQRHLTDYDIEHPISVLNLFSEDGKYFVFSTGDPFKRETYILDTELREVRKIDFGRTYYYWGADEGVLAINPLAFVKNNQHLLAFIVADNRNMIGLAVILLRNPGDIRFLNYTFRKPGPTAIKSIAVDGNDNFLYIDLGFGEPIQRFSLDELLAAKDKFPPINLEINPGKADFRYVHFLKVMRNMIIRSDHYYLGVIDLKKSEASETIVIATGTSFDIVSLENIFAAGQKEGYVIFKRF